MSGTEPIKVGCTFPSGDFSSWILEYTLAIGPFQSLICPLMRYDLLETKGGLTVVKECIIFILFNEFSKKLNKNQIYPVKVMLISEINSCNLHIYKTHIHTECIYLFYNYRSYTSMNFSSFFL